MYENHSKIYYFALKIQQGYLSGNARYMMKLRKCCEEGQGFPGIIDCLKTRAHASHFVIDLRSHYSMSASG